MEAASVTAGAVRCSAWLGAGLECQPCIRIVSRNGIIYGIRIFECAPRLSCEFSAVTLDPWNESEDVSRIDCDRPRLIEVEGNALAGADELDDWKPGGVPEAQLVKHVRVVKGQVGDDQTCSQNVLKNLPRDDARLADLVGADYAKTKFFERRFDNGTEKQICVFALLRAFVTDG